MAKAKDKNWVFTFYLAKLCSDNNLPKPQPEYKFHAARKWRIDYFFEQDGVKVGMEIEGAIWTNGRHTRGSGFIKDMEKYNEMAAHGIFLIRFPASDLPTMEMVKLLKRFF